MNLRSARSSAFMRLALVAGLVVSLSGCGFQLRGQAQLPFESAYVEGGTKAHGNELRPARFGSLANTLSQALAAQNKLAADAKSAPVRILLGNESLSKDILSLSGGGKVKEYRLIYRVTLAAVDAQGKELLAPSDIVLTRDYSYSDTEALAKEAEEAGLIRAMEQEALRQVLRRLSYTQR